MTANNVYQFRARGETAANDDGPSAQRPALRLPAPPWRQIGKGATSVLLGALKASVYVLRILTFGVLSLFRNVLHPALGLLALGLLLGAAMVFFGMSPDAPRRSMLLGYSLGGGVFCALLRYYYDVLLAWLEPTRIVAPV